MTGPVVGGNSVAAVDQNAAEVLRVAGKWAPVTNPLLSQLLGMSEGSIRIQQTFFKPHTWCGVWTSARP